MRLLCQSLLCLLIILSVVSCSGPRQLQRPMEKYQELVEQKRSVLSIPIELSITELERTLNKQLDGVVYEDNDFKDGDKMKIRAEKKEPIRVSIDSQVISYQVPVDLKIQYDAGLTVLEANGEISMDFKTAFRIREDWAIETETAVEGHEWIRTPRVRMAGISIPVGFIANLVLNNSRQYIARSIDGMVREQGGLESLVADTWQQLYEPMLVSPEYNTWLLVNPQRIGMSPITTIKDSLYTQLLIEGKPTLSVGPKPQALQATTLPPFKEEPQTFEGFLINIGATISYDEAERLARESLVGETFTSGKRAVTVEDISLWGQEDLVIVSTKLSGSYNGEIYLQGRPVYDLNDNAIELRDLDYTLDTRNFLFKSAGWLLKGTIKNRIQDNMNFLLESNIKESKKLMEQQLNNYQLAPGVRMTGRVDELTIRDVYVLREGLSADVLLSGAIKIDVKQLDGER